jgi:hypothetical protein
MRSFGDAIWVIDCPVKILAVDVCIQLRCGNTKHVKFVSPQLPKAPARSFERHLSNYHAVPTYRSAKKEFPHTQCTFLNRWEKRNKNSKNKFITRILIKIESILIFSRPFNLTACAGAYDT